jgi:hypothetical protein
MHVGCADRLLRKILVSPTQRSVPRPKEKSGKAPVQTSLSRCCMHTSQKLSHMTHLRYKGTHNQAPWLGHPTLVGGRFLVSVASMTSRTLACTRRLLSRSEGHSSILSTADQYASFVGPVRLWQRTNGKVCGPAAYHCTVSSSAAACSSPLRFPAMQPCNQTMRQTMHQQSSRTRK